MREVHLLDGGGQGADLQYPRSFRAHDEGRLLDPFLADRDDQVGALTSCRAILVSGGMVETMSRTWNSACLWLKIPFWPVIITIGMAPSSAKAAPVVRFNAPGPRVARQTPGLPVSRPWVAAMKAAACSCRVTISLIRERRNDSTTSRVSSPGTPKICSTPSFSRAATSRSEPFMDLNPLWAPDRGSRQYEALSSRNGRVDIEI